MGLAPARYSAGADDRILEYGACADKVLGRRGLVGAYMCRLVG